MGNDMDEPRPDWIRCIAKATESRESVCGREVLAFDWLFTGIEHAVACVEKETRVQPCEACLVALRER